MTSYYTRASECSHHEIFPGVDIYTAAADKMMLSLVPLPKSITLDM